jgi:DNA polymerase-2
MQDTYDGFIVHAYFDSNRTRTRLFFIGRLKGGETFAVVEDRERPGFYLRNSDRDRALGCLEKTGVRQSECGCSTIDGERCIRLSWDKVLQCRQGAQLLLDSEIRTYEADVKFPDHFLMSRNIHGSLTIRGPCREGRKVERVFINPEIRPSSWQPSLSILSVDIETDAACKEIYSIGLAFRCPWSGKEKQEVLFAGPIDTDENILGFADEKSMLKVFCDRVVDWDPDIITGWNVIDFDFRIIAERIGHFGLPFQIGRSDKPAAFLPGEKGRYHTIILPGRQVLDAVRMVRAAPERFSDYSLETVAISVLGRGKLLEKKKDESKLEALGRLYREDPVSLCRYCMEDARLVIDILDKTGLMELTIRRCMLIGISLDRAWTSIAAFDHIYIEAMHRRGKAAPTLGVDTLPVTSAPGGAILGPQTGLYDNVWVFDFKSLYPSIIRTFNIDPLSFVLPRDVSGMPEEEREHLIRAPNGACFRREAAILPELLERFFKSRDQARKKGDDIASYVFKIIMNSFYGVLGAAGSRFASGFLAGSITSLGQHLLHWCEKLLTDMGYRVLYGDTDSLFVLSGKPPDTSKEELLGESGEICIRINAELKRYIEKSFELDSFLELEFEKIYYRFFLPPVRNLSASAGREGKAESRGRAKGYAGLLLPLSELAAASREQAASEGRYGWIEVKGMEAVRRDWTDLAQTFQIGLLELVFRRVKPDSIQRFIKQIIVDIFAGKLDERLVYRKALRKPIAAYTTSRPPHVRAAGMLKLEDQRGIIEYVWTRDGPQPAALLSAPIDYGHYVEKQVKPIAKSFEEVLGMDIERLFDRDEQMWLF